MPHSLAGPPQASPSADAASGPSSQRGTELPGCARSAPWWSWSMRKPEAPRGGFPHLTPALSLTLPCPIDTYPHPKSPQRENCLLLNCEKPMVWRGRGGHRSGAWGWGWMGHLLSAHSLHRPGQGFVSKPRWSPASTADASVPSRPAVLAQV